MTASGGALGWLLAAWLANVKASLSIENGIAASYESWALEKAQLFEEEAGRRQEEAQICLLPWVHEA